MTRIALVSTQVAPFQVELADALNAISGVEYKVIFSQAQNKRPPHWMDLETKIAAHAVLAPQGDDALRAEWVGAQLEKFAPDAVLVGGVRGIHVDAVMNWRAKSGKGVPVGLWMEPPLQRRSMLHAALRRMDYLWRLKNVDFVFAIGDRAHAYYRSANPNTHFVPYGSDLSHCLDLPLPKPRGTRTIFLFSGGLQPRHNFPLIMEGFRRLFELRGPVFEFVVSGDGPQQAVIDAAIAKTPQLAPLVRYDRVFSHWQQRLEPFREAHVFLYPTEHAGWGLVIPEAMAAGNLVVASKGAEAARYLIQDGVNGVFVDPQPDPYLQVLLRCVDNRDWVEKLGMAAREASLLCNAPFVAKQAMACLKIATGGQV